MIHINLKDKDPGKQWLAKAQSATEELIAAKTLPEKYAVIDKYEGLWGELKGHLSDITSKKCWYSESRADYTILYLNLNFENLKEARKAIWKACSDLICEIQPLLELEQLNPSAARKQRIKDKMAELKKLVNPISEFSSTARTCLLSSGLDWAIRIAA